MSGREIICLRCDGAGLLRIAPDRIFVTELAARYKVEVCPGCNGRGVVLVDGPRVIKYDLDAEVKKVVFG